MRFLSQNSKEINLNFVYFFQPSATFLFEKKLFSEAFNAHALSYDVKTWVQDGTSIIF